MNNVQWAGMRLCEDAGRGCGAWEGDINGLRMGSGGMFKIQRGARL